MFALRIILGIITQFIKILMNRISKISKKIRGNLVNFLIFLLRVFVSCLFFCLLLLVILLLISLGLIVLGNELSLIWTKNKTFSLKTTLRNPKIVIGLVLGSLPWCAYMFLIMYLFSHPHADSSFYFPTGLMLYGIGCSLLTSLFFKIGYRLLSFGAAINGIWQAEVRRQYPSAHARLAQKRRS